MDASIKTRLDIIEQQHTVTRIVQHKSQSPVVAAYVVFYGADGLPLWIHCALRNGATIDVFGFPYAYASLLIGTRDIVTQTDAITMQRTADQIRCYFPDVTCLPR